MTEKQKNIIVRYRWNGMGYGTIAKNMGLKKETVAAFCQRNGLNGNRAGKTAGANDRCRECGTKLVQTAGRKTRIFCCTACRKKWWKEHPEMVNRKAIYAYSCAGCGGQFTAYGNSRRKYCSHDCYIKKRFGGGGGPDE